MNGTDEGAGSNVGAVQHVQVRCTADGTEHGVRAGTAADSSKHALAWTYLYAVGG